jgi:hypothetical protein
VREVINGSARRNGDNVDGLTSETFNNHYATISTDSGYRAPRLMLTTLGNLCLITVIMEVTEFRMLDTLRPTAIGLDLIPAWFLPLGAPIFATPLARLYDLAIIIIIIIPDCQERRIASKLLGQWQQESCHVSEKRPS